MLTWRVLVIAIAAVLATSSALALGIVRGHLAPSSPPPPPPSQLFLTDPTNTYFLTDPTNTYFLVSQ